MPIERIDHIAIVVESLDAALAVYRDALGMT
ncbi:MAG: methylmalonyl-CoA epimerase, partial [Chloroflexi bacterium HGW-Chloroflexi-1]